MEQYGVLDPTQNRKPLDTGCGSLSASIYGNGRLCSVNRYHPGQGFVTFTSIGSFSNENWYDSQQVRAYRLLMANKADETDAGFGFFHELEVLDWNCGFEEYSKPFFRYQLEHFNLLMEFEAVEDEIPYLLQKITIRNTSGNDRLFPFRIGGRFSMNRCSYGQLTEAGPIPIPPQLNQLEAADSRLFVGNPNIGACAELQLFEAGEPLSLTPCRSSSGQPIAYRSEFNTHMTSGSSKQLVILYRVLNQYRELKKVYPSSLQARFTEGMEKRTFESSWPDIAVGLDSNASWAEFVVRRNLDYILSCCSVPVTPETVCVITDHQLLPLSWNRDAYYMIQLLMEASKKEGFLSAVQKERTRKVVKGHLLWMFELAQRPDGYWGRAYLTNGFCKDKVFQLDQQCYSIVELCDYYEWTGDGKLVRRLLPKLEDLIRDILDVKDEQEWVFRTGETPADDKVDYPYHFSSQVLLAYMFRRLDTLNKEFAFSEVNFSDWCEKIESACVRHFSVSTDNKSSFAYLSDLQGNKTLYHDANDLPTVLAPLWGFCEVTDPLWLGTMQFAFSSENTGGYYSGRFEGLGSVHTPHPWPLGYAQELYYKWMTNDTAKFEQVLRKLKAICQWDGLFSEAVDEEEGTVASRHWFSWPGAFLAQVLLLTVLQTKGEVASIKNIE